MKSLARAKQIDYKRYDLRKALPPAIEAFLEAHSPSLFMTPDWIAHFSRHGLDTDLDPFLLSAENQGTPLCVLPLVRGKLRRARVSLPILGSLTNYYVLDYSIVGECGLEHWLARGLASENPALLRFDSLEEQAAEQLEQVLTAANYSPKRFESFVNWLEKCEGRSFEAWFAERPSRLRNTWRRRLNKLKKLANVRIELIGGGASMPAACEAATGVRLVPVWDVTSLRAAWEHVYARSWKREEPHPLFVPGLIELAARSGWLRLGVLYAESQPIAAQLWLHFRSRSTVYKLAYDEKYRDYSPGLVLSVEMFRNAIDFDRASVIDYGSGDDAYKQDWMSIRRVRVGLEGVNFRHPGGLLFAIAKSIRGNA